MTNPLNEVKECCITMEDINNAQVVEQEPKETENAEATATQGSEANVVSQELTIPDNWENPIKEFFKSDVFKGNTQAQKTFFDKFKSLDDGYQAKFRDLSQKEKDFASQVAKFKDNERFLNSYRDFESTIDQNDRNRILGQFGGLPQYMARLYNLDKQFSNNPLDFINGLMQASGITLDMLQNGANSPAYQQRQFQQSQAQKLGEMEQRLAELVEQRLSGQEFKNRVLAFANERDASGNLTHPHIQAVGEMMDMLMGQNPQLSLQQAYDNACYAIPEIREQILKAQFEKDTQAKMAQAEVAKAKNAQGIRSKGVVGGQKKKNWEQVLEEQIENSSDSED